MSRLTARRVLFSFSELAVLRSVAISPAVASPNGSSHRVSSRSKRDGEVQMAFWSHHMFSRKFPLHTRDGVGVDAGSEVFWRLGPGLSPRLGVEADAWASDAVEKVRINIKPNITWFAVDLSEVFMPSSPCLRTPSRYRSIQ